MIAVERYGFVPDTGGAGRWRGGLAVERHLRFKIDRGTLQIRSDRRKHLAYGLAGGEPGAPAMAAVVRADGREEDFPAKFLTTVNSGDVLKVRDGSGVDSCSNVSAQVDVPKCGKTPDALPRKASVPPARRTTTWSTSPILPTEAPLRHCGTSGPRPPS